MKKLLIVVLSLCFFATLVVGIPVGTRYTQAQIDALDMDVVPLNFQWNTSHGWQGWHLKDRKIYKEIVFDFLRPHVDGGYVSIKRTESVKIQKDYDWWLWCRTQYTLAECKTHIDVEAEYQKYMREPSVREGLKKYQTNVDPELGFE